MEKKEQQQQNVELSVSGLATEGSLRAKNLPKIRKKREKLGKRGKIGKKRQKSGRFFHFVPPDR